MDITCIIIGICHPHRLAWLKQNIDRIDSQNFPFKRKIVSVDQFDGYTIPCELRDYFVSKGWDVFVDNFKSRNMSMCRAAADVGTEYIFYNEDDVLVKLPSSTDVQAVFNHNINDRQCGMLSLTLGGGGYDGVKGVWGDLARANENTILENESYRIFVREEMSNDGYFFEFPGLFVRTKLFSECLLASQKNMRGIENGLTTTYFTGEYYKKYYKCSLGRTNLVDVLRTEGMVITSNWQTQAGTKLRLLNNLDPKQGSGPGSQSNQGFL